ncbi:MAG: NahK/ErcS family hybrid sensor histidine kinase/response regulator [Pseudomonadota bacterium]
MRDWGIQRRILFLALAPTLTVAVLMATYFTGSRFGDQEQALNNRGIAMVRHLAPASEYGLFSGNREVLQRMVAAAQKEADVRAVLITDAGGQVLARSGSAFDGLPVPAAGLGITTTTAQDGLLLVFSAPVLTSYVMLEDYYGAEQIASSSGGQTVGRVTVVLSREGLLLHKRRLLMDGLLITMLGLIGGGMLALRMSRDVTKPLLDLADAVKRLGEGQLATRVDLRAGGELQLLEEGINRMAQALQSVQADLERRVREVTAELREKKDEAEHANRAKTHFLAVASHDLRQPMHALGLFIAALRNRVQSSETRRLVDQIEVSVSAMEDLLDTLLDISKLDAGMLMPQYEDFDVHALLERIGRDFAGAAHEKGIRLRVRNIHAQVRSDPMLLERILLNLVSNAVHYTNHGGVLVGCRRRGDKLRIEVWDSGIGIADDQQQTIFQEFYQIANPERDRKKGLGLGLAIVERLVRLLRHQLRLRSVVGKGSVFSIEVPLSGGATPAQTHKAQEVLLVDALARATVLVIEDDVLVMAGMLSLLESWGCHVIAARNCDEACLKLAAGARPPDIVVCDYRLPDGMGGIETLQRLQAQLGRVVPSILVSGDTTPAVFEEARASGYQLLHKPVRPARLRALLNHLLTQRDGEQPKS